MVNQTDFSKSTFKSGWTRHIMSKNGPTKPNTRFVLLALAQFMDSDGSNCFPSVRTLSTTTGMSKTTIQKQIHIAESEGWINISTASGSGQGWKRHIYHPTYPQGVLDTGTPSEEKLSTGCTNSDGNVYQFEHKRVPAAGTYPSNTQSVPIHTS
ncbi:MAG: helix-turn-helix domain-containing protein [Candidatus Thiodiazotropha lotti]|nr:helix-turn-helix domain-containing protein [Candidatus Thiodiazotropha lotti]